MMSFNQFIIEYKNVSKNLFKYIADITGTGGIFR